MKIIKLFTLLAGMCLGSFANADYNEDLLLNQKVDFFYVAKDKPRTLVILISDA